MTDCPWFPYKRRYAHPDQAALAARVMTERTGRPVVAYPCRGCGDHHVGHEPPDGPLHLRRRSQERALAERKGYGPYCRRI